MIMILDATIFWSTTHSIRINSLDIYLNLDVGQVRNKFFDTEFQSHNN